MKKYLSKTGTYSIMLFAGFGASILFILIDYPIEMFFTISPYAERIIKAFLGSIGVILVLLFMSYKEGYKNRNIHFKESIFALSAVFILQQTLAPILTYAAYVVGTGSIYLAELFYYQNEMLSRPTTPEYLESIFMAVSYILLFAPTIMLGEWLGIRKRKIEYIEMSNLKN